ncbi:SseB family protein [Nocardioides dubius]|uniref:SseB protein N-terminal domain-containing protein n=1 Tax=Nocardioides dubius TaxID=317019 RepID=A0ABN1TPR2_9ACTN
MVNPDRFAGAQLIESNFPDDRGERPEVLTRALEEWAADRTRSAGVLRALQEVRLLVPVVAMLGEVEYDEQGLAHDKSSDMAAVLMQGRDGRLALLAFSGVETLSTWNPEARPVAVPAQVAAQSALQDDAVALVLDVAGPRTFVVQGDDLVGLASGWQLVEVDGQSGWLRPAEGDDAD